jgi:transcriptional regulator with XRE-family HTH domain
MLSLAPRIVVLTFGQWLKLARQRAGVSQRRIADALDVSVQTVGNWEGDRTLPQLDPGKTHRLCQLLEVDLVVMARAIAGEITVQE